MSVQIYTTNYFDQQREQPLGAVFGRRVEAISLLRGLVAGVQGLFGGQIGPVEKKIDDGVQGAKDDLMLAVRKQFPNATSVIGLQIQISEIGRDDQNQFLCFTAQGTAIGKKGQVAGSSRRRRGRGNTRRRRLQE